MALSLFPEVVSLPMNKGGRPAVATIPAERDRHIRCAALRLIRRATVADAAAELGVSERTVYHWTRLALGYDDPRSRILCGLDTRSHAG